jgi:adenylate cyclase, class 2
MKIEYEATFTNIEKETIRKQLKNLDAELKKAEFLQKRSVFHLPEGNRIQGGWLRVRDEGDQITMSVKVVDGDQIQDQKESCLKVDSYQEAEIFLQTIGCQIKSYQETKRELWLLDDVEITIDTWPFLETFIEIESTSEEAVRSVAERLHFNWSDAKFCATDVLYAEKYNISTDQINNHTPKIVFEMDNPFVR